VQADELGVAAGRADDGPVAGRPDAAIDADAGAALASGRGSADRPVVARAAFVGRQVQARAGSVALRRDARRCRTGARRTRERVRAQQRAAVAAVAVFEAGSNVSVAAGRGLAVADARGGFDGVAVGALLAGEKVERAVMAGRQRAVGIARRRIDAAFVAAFTIRIVDDAVAAERQRAVFSACVRSGVAVRVAVVAFFRSRTDEAVAAGRIDAVADAQVVVARVAVVALLARIDDAVRTLRAGSIDASVVEQIAVTREILRGVHRPADPAAHAVAETGRQRGSVERERKAVAVAELARTVELGEERSRSCRAERLD